MSSGRAKKGRGGEPRPRAERKVQAASVVSVLGDLLLEARRQEAVAEAEPVDTADQHIEVVAQHLTKPFIPHRGLGLAAQAVVEDAAMEKALDSMSLTELLELGRRIPMGWNEILLRHLPLHPESEQRDAGPAAASARPGDQE